MGPIGTRLKDMLNPRIEIPPYSMMPEDEVHLIMEFRAGEVWGDSRAPVATRCIISSDIMNSHLSHMEAFYGSHAKFRPDLIILSGLHLLEGIDEEKRRDRIARTVRQLKTVKGQYRQ